MEPPVIHPKHLHFHWRHLQHLPPLKAVYILCVRSDPTPSNLGSHAPVRNKQSTTAKPCDCTQNILNIAKYFLSTSIHARSQRATRGVRRAWPGLAPQIAVARHTCERRRQVTHLCPTKPTFSLCFPFICTGKPDPCGVQATCGSLTNYLRVKVIYSLITSNKEYQKTFGVTCGRPTDNPQT
ncbi:periplasmic nitrate reductase [Striga asiatica]|uniref:Periplasmic nitrate reductase n=1 Tax=Striga asiatica TaxID=4170 RepID=A0A5A7QJF2_STRAF|nr:periplasmic nitrate reductase [Striga asiatica]